MPGFPSVDVFIFLLAPQLKQLREPALECLHDVYAYLEGLAEELAEKVFARFPILIGEIKDIVSKCLQEDRDFTKEIIENVMDSEEGYLFTNDYEYLLKRTDIVPEGKDDRRNLSSTTVFVMELRQRIDAYFNLVVRNVRDRIPKAIGHFLVKKVQDKIQFNLYSEMNKNVRMSDALGEHPGITEERNRLSKTLDILKNATKVLQRDPDIANVITLDDSLERDLKEEMKEGSGIRKQPSASNMFGTDSNNSFSEPPMSKGPSQSSAPGGDADLGDKSQRQKDPNASGSRASGGVQQQPKGGSKGGNASFGNLFG